MASSALRKVLTTSFSLAALVLTHSGAWATSIPSPVNPLDGDYLKLLDSVKSYTATPDLQKVFKVDSSFYTKDEKTMAELQRKVEEEFKAYLKNADAKQSTANPILIQSLNDAYTVSRKKLEIQKAAAEAFGQALKEATKLVEDEKRREESCVKEFNAALLKGNEVNKVCNDQENDDDKNACGEELKSCAAKINADFDKFNEYLKIRSKKQASMAAFKEVSAIADELGAEITSSKQVCNHFSLAMAQVENGGNCLSKIESDGPNEAYLGLIAQGQGLAIHGELDSNMFVPANRIAGWKIFKKMADDKVAETTAEMKKIKENIEKLGGVVLDLADGSKTGSAIAILTNNGTVVTEEMIKNFFASNPSPEAILKAATELGLTKQQIAHAMNIAGYGGETPSDLNNYAQTKALEEKFMKKIDEYVAAKGGNFNGTGGAIQVPGFSQVDVTKNVLSNKGWITPEMVKKFLDTKPTDQQFFAKMAELGLRSSDIATLLNGQGLLYKNGDPKQVLANDSTYGSIYNRLALELYQGVTGFGVSDTYDPTAPIVQGTGHIMSEDNKVWIPYGFKSATNQKVNTDNQAQPPVNFVSGGQFGVDRAVSSLKLIKPDELKKLRIK